MHQRRRGWIMPEADMLSMLKLIEERIRSPEISVRHRDALIRLRDILEQDLNSYQSNNSSNKQPTGEEVAAKARSHLLHNRIPAKSTNVGGLLI